jgi:hypothetical protein
VNCYRQCPVNSEKISYPARNVAVLIPRNL